MRLKAALVFLLAFSVAVRAASAFSWASSGTALTAAGLLVAVSLAGIATGLWYARRAVHHPVEIRSRQGRFATAHWS